MGYSLDDWLQGKKEKRVSTLYACRIDSSSAVARLLVVTYMQISFKRRIR
jgi:hypothetical protein